MSNEQEVNSSNNNDNTAMDVTDDGVEASISTAGMFYNDLISQMLSQATTCDGVSALLGKATKEVAQKTNEPFSISKFTDEVARKLLLSPEDASSPMDVSGEHDNSSHVTPEPALQLVQALAQIDASLYLPSLAASVHKLIVREDHPVEVSSSLLLLWMQQLTQSDSVAVHSHLLGALVVLSQRDPSIVAKSIDLLVKIWSESLLRRSQKDASIVSVRCATLWIEWTAKLGGAVVLTANQEAPDLFVRMVKNFDDPLQQLTMIDLLVEHFGSSTESSTAAESKSVDAALQEWLAAPALISPILQMLQDPLLSGVALQYLSGVLVSLRPHELQLVLDHIRQCGTVSNETERLQIVFALSNVATTVTTVALPTILQDPALRGAWWDIARVSQSKLQAAVLSSIALSLPKVNANDAALAMKLYNAVGPDNSTSGISSVCTTQWLLERFVASPMPELRIGAYAVLAAMLRLQNAGQIMALDTPKVVQSKLLELWMDLERRESTSDARLAYFDVLESLYGLLSNKNGPNTPTSASIWLATMQDEQLHKVAEILQKKVRMGPHGREPQRWDIATE